MIPATAAAGHTTASPASPVGSRVALRCPSGIAGNMWLATALALGADPEPLLSLPARLDLGSARLVWWCDDRGGVARTDLEVVDVHPRLDGTGADLIARIRAAALPGELERAVLAALARRRRADRGTAFARQRSWGPELADTLIDLVGGVVAWDLLGRPEVTVHGPLALGSAAGGVKAVLGPIPWTSRADAPPLTTATGAALLRGWWAPGPAPGPDTAAHPRCEVHSAFVRQHGLAPLTAMLHHPAPAPAPAPATAAAAAPAASRS